MSQYLSEAFKKLNLLNEETFSVTNDGLDDFIKFEEEDEYDDTINVIDAEAETIEDLQDSYVGKVILDCCVCHSKLYKDVEDVVIEDDIANANEECPFCYTTDGFKVVGQVAEFGEEEGEENTEEDSEEIKETDEEESEELEEGIFGKKKSEKTIKASQLKKGDLIVATEDGRQSKPLKVKAIGNNGGSVAIDFPGGNMSISPDEDVTILAEGLFDKKPKGTKTIKASQLQRGHKIVATQDGKQDKPLRVKNVGENGGSVTIDFNGGNMSIHPDEDVEILDENISDIKNNEERELEVRDESESLKEDINNLSLDTDDTHMEMTSDENGKVTISTEPIANTNPGEEVIAPLEPEVQNEIDNNVEDGGEIEIDMDEFDEESFDELGEGYLKKVYENVNSFKTSNVTFIKDKLILEGVISFTSGKSKKTNFVFGMREATKSGKVRFIGENKEIARGRKSFTVTGRVQDKKFLSESLNYNYGVRNANGKAQRLYGTVKRG